MADGCDWQQVTRRLVQEESRLSRWEGDRSPPQRLLLLELFDRRESFAYLWCLVHYWREWRLAGHLDVVVTPQFLQSYPEILDLVQRQATPNIQITAIAPAMAALLTQAAKLQKPILTTDEGLVGERVKRGQLGLTLRAGDTQHLAVALAYLLEAPLERVGDRQQMRQFAAWNTDVCFAETGFRYLCFS